MAAKFVVVVLWAGLLTSLIYLLGLAVVAIGLPPASPTVIVQGGLRLALTACLTMSLVPSIAFLASAGGGYVEGGNVHARRAKFSL